MYHSKKDYFSFYQNGSLMIIHFYLLLIFKIYLMLNVFFLIATAGFLIE